MHLRKPSLYVHVLMLLIPLQEELMRTMAAHCIFEAFPPEAWVVTQEMPGSRLSLCREV
jgi:hypothetical protein